SWWLEGLPNSVVRKGVIASSTSRRTGAVAARSKYGMVSVQLDVETQVERPHAVGDRPHRNHVDARAGDVGNRLEGYSPTGVDDRAARDEPHALAQLLDREVVEQDRVDACREHRLDLVDAVDLDLEVHRVAELGARVSERLGEVPPTGREHREVVVLREHRIREREAVIAATTTPHRVAFQDAKARGRLARVRDAGGRFGDRLDIAGRLSRDAAHPLQKVEGHPFGTQDAASISRDASERHASVEALAVT